MSYVDRMLDYAREIHSIPESAAAPDEQEATFGPLWDRPVCDCKLYPQPHAGCPGQRSAGLPRVWKSGDDV